MKNTGWTLKDCLFSRLDRNLKGKNRKLINIFHEVVELIAPLLVIYILVFLIGNLFFYLLDEYSYYLYFLNLVSEYVILYYK